MLASLNAPRPATSANAVAPAASGDELIDSAEQTPSNDEPFSDLLAEAGSPGTPVTRKRASTKDTSETLARVAAGGTADPETTEDTGVKTSEILPAETPEPADYSIGRRLAKPASPRQTPAPAPAPAPDATPVGPAPATQSTSGKSTDTASDIDSSGEASDSDKPVTVETGAPKTLAGFPDDALALMTPMPQVPPPPAAPLSLGLPHVPTPVDTAAPESAGTNAAAIPAADGSSAKRTTTASQTIVRDSEIAQVAATVAPRTSSAGPAQVAQSKNTPPPADTATPVNPVKSAPIAATASVTPAFSDPATTSEAGPVQLPKPPVPNLKMPASGTPAQIAASAAASVSPATSSASYKIKNTVQVTEKEVYTKQYASAGIERAMTPSAMPSVSTTLANPAQSAISPTLVSATPVATTSPVTPTAATEAVRMIERVAEVADHLASHPSEQVTLRIDLDDTNRVDVRVSMRGGRVQTDFRTESPEMRSALTHAWNSFSATRTDAAQRWADPTFATLPVPVQPVAGSITPVSGSSAPSGGFNFDADRGASQQQQTAQQRDLSAGMAGPRAPSVGPRDLSAEPAPFQRQSDTSRHLSLFA